MSPYEPRPEGLNTEPAPPSVVETLRSPLADAIDIAMKVAKCGDDEVWDIESWRCGAYAVVLALQKAYLAASTREVKA
ncbi:hypothetical protein PCO31111_04882 [Pandoraea communis]|uniref:Uncharacterized protein n=1 Tax=Pandoraea communis TaxID=2508297 RepID=A0A5E4YWM9_9BURK|nr:hypothetical protein [Pandoraea communis]VVE53334.1 hypothetical protein PCO31111_04882 [Pandoraea communis]